MFVIISPVFRICNHSFLLITEFSDKITQSSLMLNLACVSVCMNTLKSSLLIFPNFQSVIDFQLSKLLKNWFLLAVIFILERHPLFNVWTTWLRFLSSQLSFIVAQPLLKCGVFFRWEKKMRSSIMFNKKQIQGSLSWQCNKKKQKAIKTISIMSFFPLKSSLDYYSLLPISYELGP